MTARRRVALIIETSSSYGRALLAGIIRFMRMHDEWSVFLEQRELTKKPPAWLASWKGDGIISRATTQKLVDAVASTGVPLVDLTDRGAEHRSPLVRSDDERIGQMAAEHLLERGFRRFGFCGFSGEAWSRRRHEAFAASVAQAGATCAVYQSPWHGEATRDWEDDRRQLSDWLLQIPRPCGIMACNDIRGQHVLDACSDKQLAVPEEVAVIGVDNDDLLCRLCDPTLSSVVPNAEGVGYRAAVLLSRLINGCPSEVQLHLVEPLGVATRQSTDVIAIDDAEVAAALRYIRENACRGIHVDDIIRHVPVSRSTLERKLRKYLGRTPQQEIRHVQLKRVRELLATTDLSAERIAVLCGFEHPEYMHVLFKRELKMTPGEFRKTAQP